MNAMNFNIDDPLAELLSDNSVDDSFFENQSGIKKQFRNTSTVGTKGKMEHLFGIKDESAPKTRVSADQPTSAATTVIDKPQTPSTPKAKIEKFDETGDILSDLGFDPKRPKSTFGTKANIFDDILKPIDIKKPKTAPYTKTDEISSNKGTISRQSTETTDNSGIPGMSRPKTSTGRRSSITSTVNNTLDLFPTIKDKEVPKVPTPKARKKGGIADWLKLGADSEEEPLKSEEKRPSEIVTQSQLTQAVPMNSSFFIQDVPFLMNTALVENQNVTHILQQQESQINIAAQMKQQEQALLDMQRRQHELISRQEMQFNDLLQKQFSRQNQLEQTIKVQQDRINAHIQMLLSQPINAAYSSNLETDSHEKSNEQQLEETKNLVVMEAEIKRLELEKLRLEDLISHINANYEKEIEVMEKSFRKQIKVLEDHLTAVEERLQKEIKSLHDYYMEKLKIANNDKEELKNRFETELKNIKDSQDCEIQRLKSIHNQNFEALREDHQKMIDNIRQSKLLEFAVVQENGSYLESLRLASSNLECVSGGLQSLKAEMEHKIDIIHKDRESKLESREKRLEDSERRIKLVEETAKDEKRRLLELVSSLEAQLLKLGKESSDENWIIRQKLATLEAEKLAFENEKAFARDQIARDEKRIEDLKNSHLQESQRQLQLIKEERNQLNIEKVRFETAKKVDPNFQVENVRKELDAAINIAQDATKQAENERENCFRLQRQLESQKRQLIEKENKLISKEEDLDQEISLLRVKERQARDAAAKARLTQQHFKEKLMAVQTKIQQTTEKEALLSQERLKLSQELIAFQVVKKNIDQNRCSLCRIGEINEDISDLLRANNKVTVIPNNDEQNYINLESQSARNDMMADDLDESIRRIAAASTVHWDCCNDAPVDTVEPNTATDAEYTSNKYNSNTELLRNL